MKTFQALMLTAVIAALSVTIASAGTQTPRVDRREMRQHVRIERGVRNGELTRRETRRLAIGQRHIHRMERRARSDGFVSARERTRLGHAQDRESRRIYRLKHNDYAR